MNSYSVEFVLVGGHAVAYHGYPRFTGDIDFFVRRSPANARKLIDVLTSFGFNDVAELESLLVQTDKVVQLGRPPNRIDLLTGISGITFEEAMSTSVGVDFDGLPIRMIGFDTLLKNKTASARPKDLVDVVELEKHRKKGQA